MDILSAAILLFLTLDPIGNVPICLSLLDEVAPERRLRVLLRELVLALLVLGLFLFTGPYILGFMHLRQESISIAGGIILFLIAIKMVFPVPRSVHSEEEFDGEPLLVPLAIPLIAGPSAIATLLLMVTREPQRIWHWSAALFAAWLVSAIILLSATRLKRLLGRRGLIAMERLMGMILVAIAVQMFLDGVSAYLK
ncbi:MAG: YhgN family NAAT transporter [Wenzhouxiangellaceae bacterium]